MVPRFERMSAFRETLASSATLGYSVKGVVHAVIGVLAVLAAHGWGVESVDSKGAIEAISTLPLGRLLVAGTAVGLLAYSLWRVLQSVFDPEQKGTSVTGWLARLGLLASAAAYASAGSFAVRIALGVMPAAADGDDDSERAAEVLGLPFGAGFVAAAGLVGLWVGGYQLFRAASGKFLDRLEIRGLSRAARRALVETCRVGICSRALVFATMGLFWLRAALWLDPAEAGGFDRALRSLQEKPFGPYLLTAAGAGILAYAVYCGTNARYRRIG